MKCSMFGCKNEATKKYAQFGICDECAKDDKKVENFASMYEGYISSDMAQTFRDADGREPTDKELRECLRESKGDFLAWCGFDTDRIDKVLGTVPN